MVPLTDVLVELGKLRPEDRRRVERLQERSDEPAESLLLKLGLISSRDRAEALAVRHGLALVTPEQIPATPLLPDRLTLRFLRAAQALPVAADEQTVILAMADPADAYTLHAVELATGRTVEPRVAAADDLEEAFGRYTDDTNRSHDIQATAAAVEPLGNDGDPDVQHLLDLAQEAPVIRLVNQIIAEAVRLQASDIHVETYRDQLKLRYRIHGILREMPPPPPHLGAAVISRIKILARLDIAERRLPQEDRARFAVAGRTMDLRVATLPTMHGENAVIRLLDSAGMALDLARIGMAPAVEQRLRRHLHGPNGIILVTGPTGSGKTTTLYAALRLLNDPARKIVTVEDPVEYQIAGINQVNVRPKVGLDFARVLRSCLRHDPDVIMVGEIRDRETATIAVHASLTGHLVLSTLHTNSAAGAINRLIDMGVDDFLLASTVRGVIGQRLVRQLCPACRRPGPASPDLVARLHEAGHAVGPDTILWQPAGCPACEHLGFTGRLGIFEFLEMNEALRELLRRKVSSLDLARAAAEQGMITMFQDGLAKALAGQTTADEVLRVTEDW